MLLGCVKQTGRGVVLIWSPGLGGVWGAGYYVVGFGKVELPELKVMWKVSISS